MSNRANYYKYKFYSLLLYFTPLGILFGINHEAYISTSGSRLSFFGMLMVLVAALAAKNKLSDVAKKNTILTFSVLLFLVAFVMRFLADQLLYISGASIIGSLLSNTTEQVADVYHSRSFEVDANGRKRKINKTPLAQKEAWGIALRGEEMTHG